MLSCRLSGAVDPGTGSVASAPASSASANPGPTYGAPANPATTGGPSDLGAPATPAMMALPADDGSAPGDSSTHRKFYTLTASLREVYDDNADTSSFNPRTSLETDFSPSILVDFPSEGNDFSARYTLSLTYYDFGASNSAANAGRSTSETQLTHELVAQYSHASSDRFNLNLAESFRYYIQPSLDQSTGTNYQNGYYATNVLNGTLNAQWTPLIGTTSNFSNTVVRYDEALVARTQNSIENIGTQSVGYGILPKISTSLGGIVDSLTYETATRGYTTYTLFAGGSWQVLPSLSVTARGGGTYVVPLQGQDTTAPYAALTIGWDLGARSSLTFDYAHEITPSDQIGANGQTSDRFDASFSYKITTQLTSHLSGTFTHAIISQDLATSGGGVNNGYNENDYYVDTGFAYQYNSYLSFDTGITLSGVDSSLRGDSYTRDEGYVGVRGTY